MGNNYYRNQFGYFQENCFVIKFIEISFFVILDIYFYIKYQVKMCVFEVYL